MTLQPFGTEITQEQFEELRQIVAQSETTQPTFNWLCDHDIIALGSEIIDMILIHKMESGLDINHLTDNT